MEDHMRLAKRLEQLPPYLFARIDAARAKAQAKGLDTVSMGIGDPDRDPPQWIRELLCEEVMRSGNHRYPSYKGHPSLHAAAARYMERRFGISGLDNSHFVTTIGSKEGLANLVTAVINPGDCILMPDPMYPVFGTMARLAGGEMITMPVHPSTDFMPNPHAVVCEDRAHRARVMYVNYPHNPTGQVATREYLQSLVDFAREHGVILVSDAAYTEVYYGEENRPHSLLEFPGAMDCVLEFHSFSKSFNMTGWRCGFAVGNPELAGALHTVKSNMDSGCFNAIQLAMARALDDERCDGFLAENRDHYHQRLNRVVDALEGMGVKVHRPGASIFVWCELPAGELDSFDWCGRLLDTTGLVVSPGAAYGHYGEGFFRVSLSTPDEKIGMALDKLAGFVKGAASSAG
jgi:LL-diaminopimelate aminotransferase